MDLRKVLTALKNHLLDSAGFSPELEGLQTVQPVALRALAILNLGSVGPLDLFIEWLGREPAALDVLRTVGLGWGFDPVSSNVAMNQPASAPKDIDHVSADCLNANPEAPQGLMFRVKIGDPGKYLDAALIEVVGQLLKVQLAGSRKLTATVTMDQVSPVDRERVLKAVATLPGSQIQLEWADELPQDQNPPTEPEV